MSRLTGRVALVTGAGRGIGREIALRLGAEQAHVVVHYSSSSAGANEVVTMIRNGGGQAVAYRADISKKVEIERLFEQIDRLLGRLDIVVNNAGVSGGGPLTQLDEDEIDAMLAINLRGPLLIAGEAAKRLSSGGRIINIGSSIGEFPIAGSGIYSATKVAIKAFTECWAKELAAKGVTVNTVMPGATSPGLIDQRPANVRKWFENASPFGRIGRAEEIAAVVAFLASPEASWISGAHILANGAANT